MNGNLDIPFSCLATFGYDGHFGLKKQKNLTYASLVLENVDEIGTVVTSNGFGHTDRIKH